MRLSRVVARNVNPNPGEELAVAALEVQRFDGAWAAIATWTGPEAEARAQAASAVLKAMVRPCRGVMFVGKEDGRLLARRSSEPRLVQVAEFTGPARGALAAVAALRLNSGSGAIDATLARLGEESALEIGQGVA